MLLLGIETSCDETAAAVISGTEVKSDVIHSQIALHAAYGGVVPELASRDHLRNIRPVITQALSEAGVTLRDLDAVCVTCRPGLAGALLIGTQVASSLCWAADIPLIGVDHLMGHLLAVYLDFPETQAASVQKPSFPYIGLLASGGHTAIYRVNGPFASDITELGATRDDAAGEAYDKVAKLLGLGYPGGPIIDKLAQEGDASVIPLVKPMPQKKTLEFSFSGLKTHLARWVQSNGLPKNDDTLRNLCASFQQVVVETLMEKSIAAAKQEGISEIVLAGGVSANSALRKKGQQMAAAAGLTLVVPHFRACTDNAAMIALAGSFRAKLGEDDRGRLEISPKTLLPRVTQKGGGPRNAPPAR